MGEPLKPVRGTHVPKDQNPSKPDPKHIFARVHQQLSSPDYRGEHAIGDYYVAEKTVFDGSTAELSGRRRVGDMIPLEAFFGSVPGTQKGSSYDKANTVAHFFGNAGWDIAEDIDGNRYVVGVPHEGSFITVAELTEIRAQEAKEEAELPPKKMTAGPGDDAKALEKAAKRFKKDE